MELDAYNEPQPARRGIPTNRDDKADLDEDIAASYMMDQMLDREDIDKAITKSKIG